MPDGHGFSVVMFRTEVLDMCVHDEVRVKASGQVHWGGRQRMAMAKYTGRGMSLGAALRTR